MQQTCPAPKTPCQLTLHPPSWLVIESALGPVTTTLADAESGNVLFWLRNSVMDSCAAWSVLSRPAVTAALAELPAERHPPVLCGGDRRRSRHGDGRLRFHQRRPGHRIALPADRHRLSRARSCTGAKSHTQPVARSAFAVAAPPA